MQFPSQLERDDFDLTQMIWQARSRLIFANSARDADLLADELAKLTFFDKRVKDVRTSLKQLIVGYRKEWLESVSTTATRSDASMEQQSVGYNRSWGDTIGPRDLAPTRSHGHGNQDGSSHGVTAATSRAESQSRSQANVPIHVTFPETSSITYQPFEEWAIEWGQRIRSLRTGEAFAMFANAPGVHSIAVNHFPLDDSPASERRVEELLARNYESDCFLTASDADREIEACRRLLLTPPPIVIPAAGAAAPQRMPGSAADPFR